MDLLEVKIEQGFLKGSLRKNYHGKNFFSFQGIPYAKPPLGGLRFKAPEPPAKWEGVLDATKEGSACYSRSMLDRTAMIGSEDCLFLNVYTQRSSTPKPVMFFIHGGAFLHGSSSSKAYGPEFLLMEDVVLVTINYRLGILGFLSFDNPALEIPGNAGFKDMVLALKWVQSNISSFGGDPNNVTIFGESAGGVSVHLLLLSPLTKGLFHKAVVQSGCGINPFVVSLAAAPHLAGVLHINDDNQIYDHLQKLPVDELLKVQNAVLSKSFIGMRKPFRFVIEPDHEGAFLSEEPIKILREGRFHKVPVTFGYNTGEGMLFQIDRNLADVANIVEESIPWDLADRPDLPEIIKSIKNFYFRNGEEPLSSKFQFLGDVTFVHGLYNSARYHSISMTPTFLYRVSIESELSFFKKFIKVTEPGTCHGDELPYLFKNFMCPAVKPGSKEETAILRFVKLWTNFAKFGHPTPTDNPLIGVTWKPIEENAFNIIDIGDDLVISESSDMERIEFWDRIYRNF